MSDKPVRKPAMSSLLVPLAAKAHARHQKRWAPPEISIERNGDGWRPACPYRTADEDAWWMLLLDAFGTRVYAVVATFLEQLINLCPQYWEPDAGNRPSEDALRTAVAIVASMKPENEAQACLAAQAVAVHFSAMRVAERLGSTSLPDPRTLACLAALGKTYAGQLETMQRLKGRGGTRQTIVVKKESHVHYHDERHVHLRGGGSDSGDQPQGSEPIRAHARATGKPQDVAALPSPDEGGTVVSFASGEGQEGLPSPRGLKRVGRSKG